ASAVRREGARSPKRLPRSTTPSPLTAPQETRPSIENVRSFMMFLPLVGAGLAPPYRVIPAPDVAPRGPGKPGPYKISPYLAGGLASRKGVPLSANWRSRAD